MTGYGRGEVLLEGGKLNIEIRSLNSKNADISVKSTLFPREKEIYVRKQLAETLTRGSIDVFIIWEPNATESAKHINTEMAKDYYRQIIQLSNELGLSGVEKNGGELITSLLKMPDVLEGKKQEIITDENWPLVESALNEAMGKLNEFRTQEGEILKKDVSEKVNKILSFVDELEKYENERTEIIRNNILKKIEEYQLTPDPHRLEQEIIYYLEKLDINEEKVRLRQHCRYFLENLESSIPTGKKLGFIAQEMGREINTTGSKANHVEIQKIVVQMKDELEKIKEQCLNIL